MGEKYKEDHGNLVVYKCYYHRMQIRAEDNVFPDDAIEFERRQPGDKHSRAAGGCGLHSCGRTGNYRRRLNSTIHITNLPVAITLE